MKEKVLNSFYFILLWLAYIVVQIFQVKIRNIYDVIAFLFSLIFGWIIAIILLFVVDKAKLNFIKSFFISSLLICTDQIIKVLVNSFVKSKTINVLNGIIRIRIVHNTYNSAIFCLFDIHIQNYVVIWLKIVSLIILVLIIRKLSAKCKNPKYLLLSGILLISGFLSSIVDSIAWGYSLDYINIPRYGCVIDLKDIYINFGIGSLLLYLSKFYYNRKDKQTLK